MNNNDRFELAMRRNPLEVASLAIQFSSGCGSRNNAWNWANAAVDAAKQAGVTLDPGTLSWPELQSMQSQLEAAQP